ncbi:sensor histidine kinase [Paenibacillus alkalitolerans]|uniref:sensor histidine kinase n=1 Tax=Paenibacillus alkalitolerans TaxID=2799335 RepID=UPI0018F3FA1D|nr:ATP-binding protein [Paenibacillus alkalitolerans]
MSVRRKLFIAIASFIIGMGFVFTFVTQVVLRDVLDVMVEAARRDEIGGLSAFFTDYYEKNNSSWEGIGQIDARTIFGESSGRDASFVLKSRKNQVLYTAGDARYTSVMNFGIRSRLLRNGETIGFLYYYDADVDRMSKLRLGILDSTMVLLAVGSVALVLISLLVAYWLSKRLTAPLKLLISAIDRLGKGEFGVQVPAVSKDEYGKVAETFNGMSIQLQRSEEIRRNLVADVAHELRTPLTIIRGKLDLVQQHGQRIEPESLLPLQDELIRLSRLVDDLHQLSLAEAKKLPLERKPTDMCALLRRIVERVAPDAESKEIEVTLTCNTGNATLNVDPNRMMQVFLNLLVNAIRYTPKGGSVKIAVDERPAPDGDGGLVRITVSDTGIGIDPGHLPFLFNRFYRTDEARTRNTGGMGLGLAIAKEFVGAHNGTIEAESRPGEGTTFIVTLPKAATA